MEKRRSLVSTESLKNMELSISFNSNTISIYPNPSSGHVWIKSNTYSETNFNIIVRDVLGMEKAEIKNIALPFDLDLSNNAKGVYLINISNGKISTTQKIIIQ